ncbi:MAG: aldehyde dehydrogenase family protein [Alphaproteobacteria bacterium]|nr:aldehyde dehydrogenase family protein [Alphaproteobacteria bacterium]
MEDYKLYIDGKFENAESGDTYKSINPYNGEAIATIPQGSARDADRAIRAARKAFDEGPWPRMAGEERSALIGKAAGLLKERMKDYARLESLDSGGTINKTGADAFLAARQLAFFAEQAKRFNGEPEEIPGLQREGRSFNYVIREPMGVCAQIIPWNFPYMMAIWKLGPALATGNTVVLKPASLTPVMALELARVCDEVGIPPGVVNIITGPGGEMGAAMTEHPLVDKVAFTGSTEVGRDIMAKAAGTLKKVTLECGGKGANIVLDDADWDVAVDGSIWASFYHQGQVCESGTRLMLSAKDHDGFVEQMVDKLNAMKMGDPLDKETQLGPVVSEGQMKSVLDYVAIGKGEGAKLMCGGARATGGDLDKGCFVRPTLFTGVTNDMRIAREEIFGPVLAVLKYGSEDEAVALANDSIYGLSGGVWSRNIDRARKVAGRLRTGTVWINEWHMLSERAPFGGYKQSGVGREFGDEGLGEYCELKTLYIDDAKTRENKPWYDMVVARG